MTDNLNMFCITLEPSHYDFIKKKSYIPVGLGEKNFPNDWFTDKSKNNIAIKNKNYGEYTFHYWLWKNYLNEIKDGWIGFCQYRKFWSLKNYSQKDISIESLNNQILKKIPEEYNNYESILGEPMFINQWRTMKFLKTALKLFIKKPSLIIKKKRNIKFHFDWMHGEGNLMKAIDLLDTSNKKDFKKFVVSEVSFNPQNMFICKSTNILKKYYEDLFPWLERCEKIFPIHELKGFGRVRIYGFLAERFMSYWFKKNTKYTTMPIIFHDIRNDIE